MHWSARFFLQKLVSLKVAYFSKHFHESQHECIMLVGICVCVCVCVCVCDFHLITYIPRITRMDVGEIALIILMSGPETGVVLLIGYQRWNLTLLELRGQR